MLRQTLFPHVKSFENANGSPGGERDGWGGGGVPETEIINTFQTQLREKQA
jgi:hypothetical protein